MLLRLGSSAGRLLLLHPAPRVRIVRMADQSSNRMKPWPDPSVRPPGDVAATAAPSEAAAHSAVPPRTDRCMHAPSPGRPPAPLTELIS